MVPSLAYNNNNWKEGVELSQKGDLFAPVPLEVIVGKVASKNSISNLNKSARSRYKQCMYPDVINYRKTAEPSFTVL